MPLPSSVLEVLTQRMAGLSKRTLQDGRRDLTQRYYSGEKAPRLTEEENLAYLAARLPATYGVVRAALSPLAAAGFRPKTSLDLGAGPGTATLAALETFPDLTSLLLLDQNPFFKDFAEEALTAYPAQSIYMLQNLAEIKILAPADLVLCSYVLGELTSLQQHAVVERAWAATAATGALVLITPGTPHDFGYLRNIRAHLIEAGAKIVAPCTHEGVCPLQDDDWCHFSVRIARDARHRQIKEATLPYEDEKYSYLIATRSTELLRNRPTARIVRPPLLRTGHVVMDICARSGLARLTIPKREKELYKEARKAAWGEGWP